ncbi:MAG: MMPL family transporter [Psychromonas sp.]|nr:MMPL family transporter [Psychromonas sp.]
MNKLPLNYKFALLWLVVILCSLFLLVQQTLLTKHLPIETNILALLPKDSSNPFAEQAFTQISDQLNNKVLLMIGGTNKKQVFAAAPYFEKGLKSLDMFSSVSGNISAQQQQSWGDLYFPVRAQLLTNKQKQRLTNHPHSQIQRVLSQVYNPFSGVTGKELKKDPFLLFREYISDKAQGANKLHLEQGYLTASDHGLFYIVLHGQLNASPYNVNLQKKLSQLTQLEQQVESKFQVKISHAGTLFYASYGTKSAKNEISTIGVGSMIGSILLLLFFYRSALPIMLALLSVFCGLLVAFVITVLVFGKVHLFSLVFGASLIGVSIDYAFHYLTDRLLNEGHWDSSLALRHIFNAITLGLLTSLIGYLGLLVAPFPGLQQLSLFSIVGLISAYLTVVCWYPLLAKSASTSKKPNLTILRRWLHLWQHKQFRIYTPVILLVTALIALTQVHFNDDIHQLQAMPKNLKKQESLIQTVTGIGQKVQVLLVKEDSKALLLNRLHQVSNDFNEWKKQGYIDSYQSISNYVPTIKEQRKDYQLVKKLYSSQSIDLAKRLNFALPPSSLPNFSALTIEQFLASKASTDLRFLWLQPIHGEYSSIIVIHGLTQQKKLVKYIDHSADLIYLNKAQKISAIFKDYREHISWLLVVAYLLVSFALFFRYGLSLTFKVVFPPFVAGCLGLAITSVFGIPITIFNLLALILILGIGIDYTLFFAEQRQQETANTFLSVSLSALTTILSFGLLALSETQAIHGFGVTILTGITCAWLSSPLAMQRKTNANY